MAHRQSSMLPTYFNTIRASKTLGNLHKQNGLLRSLGRTPCLTHTGLHSKPDFAHANIVFPAHSQVRFHCRSL